MPRRNSQLVLQPSSNTTRNTIRKRYPKNLIRKAVIPIIRSVRTAVRPSRRRRARTQLPRNSLLSRGSNMNVVSLPADTSIQLGKSVFSISGKASPNSEYDSDTSLRVHGAGMLSSSVISAGPGTGAFNSTVTHGTPYWYPITPNNLDSRVGYFETIYQYYIIRDLKITYIPAVGSQSQGLLALGVSANFDDLLVVAAPQLFQVMEYSSTVLTPVWAPASLTVRDNGSKAFSSNQDADGLLSYQYLLAGTMANVLSTATTYGLLHAEFTIDFYQPRPFNATISLTSKKPEITILEESDEDIIAQMVKDKLNFKKSLLTKQ